MAKISTCAYAHLIARLVLAAVFLMAALPKIQDSVAFAGSIEGFRVIPVLLTAWVALILPWLELVVGFGLLMPQLRRSSALIVSGLLIVFIILHASAWARGLNIDCGCFGLHETVEPPKYLWLITRNTLLLLASVAVFRRDLLRDRELRNLSVLQATKA